MILLKLEAYNAKFDRMRKFDRICLSETFRNSALHDNDSLVLNGYKLTTQLTLKEKVFAYALKNHCQ